jgi:hypothetical protein
LASGFIFIFCALIAELKSISKRKFSEAVSEKNRIRKTYLDRRSAERAKPSMSRSALKVIARIAS